MLLLQTLVSSESGWYLQQTMSQRRNCKYVFVSSLRANSVVPPPEENIHY